MPSFTINARGYGSRRSRLCEKSVVQFACRTSVSVSSIRKPIALATSVGRRQLRKQFCASLAHATFHTAWTRSGHRTAWTFAKKLPTLPLGTSGQDFEMKRCAFITLGDDVPPAARVQQPAGEVRLPAA